MCKFKIVVRNAFEFYDSLLYWTWRVVEKISFGESLGDSSLHNPLISIVTPTFNTNIVYLKKMIDSVINQDYENWELIIVDDCSSVAEVRRVIKSYAEQDNRIIYKFLSENHGIAKATNTAIKMTRGEYIGLLDHDDIIYETALCAVVKVINLKPGVKFIYSDEDKIKGRKRVQPLFKPDWNLSLLHSINYITHFAVISKDTLDKFGYENGEFNGAQDWELFLRLGRHLSVHEIAHIPQVLYGWRIYPMSTASSLDAKPYVFDAQIKAVREDLSVRGVKNADVGRSVRYPGQLVVGGKERKYGIKWREVYSMLGFKRSIFILLSSRLSLSRHVYRTVSYDKIMDT